MDGGPARATVSVSGQYADRDVAALGEAGHHDGGQTLVERARQGDTEAFGEAGHHDGGGQSLVERARQGDTEAFGKLIEHHQCSLKRLAERMTGDPYLADDIVQDALIRAFLHLGSLADTSRFLPWLNRIVRNQANMRLRRGGPYRHERPLSSIKLAEMDSAVDWGDLDNLLEWLTRKSAGAAHARNAIGEGNEDDPEEMLLRQELLDMIHALLHCLNAKEYAIFKAFFFQQLDPNEIAAMYQTTTGTVYTYLYRSRQKLRKEAAQSALGPMLERKEGENVGRRNVLKLPDWPAHESVMTTMVDCVGRMLAMLGDGRPMPELMGDSTMAFRMKISQKTTYADGIYIFDWRRTLQEWMYGIGYRITQLCGQLANSPVPLLGAVERFPVVLPMAEAVVPFIRRYLDQGKPLLYFDSMAARPYVHEWSIIYGYDDDKRLIYMTDRMQSGGKAMTYEDVANNPVRFIAGIDGHIEEGIGAPHAAETGERARAERTIRFAVRYARQGCDYEPMTNYLRYASGLAAYDQWLDHLRRSFALNRYGLGQLAAVYAETKTHAALYLRSVPLKEEAMRMTLLASEAYEQAAQALKSLSGYVPFIRTTEMLSPELRASCVACLEEAKTFETAAIGYLKKAISHFEEGAPG